MGDIEEALEARERVIFDEPDYVFMVDSPESKSDDPSDNEEATSLRVHSHHSGSRPEIVEYSHSSKALSETGSVSVQSAEIEQSISVTIGDAKRKILAVQVLISGFAIPAHEREAMDPR